MTESLDISQALKSMFQAVPMWAFVGWAIAHWFKKTSEERKELNTRLQVIDGNIAKIQSQLNEAGVKDLKENIEKLKEAKVRDEMNIQAIWKILDPKPRKSDI